MTSESGERAKAILKAEMRRQGVTYDDLAARLTASTGTPTSGAYLRKKVSLGGFSAGFFIDALAAIGAKEVRL